MSANNPMSFYSENVDAWGPLEWFDRLAKAVHARSQAVRDKDDIAFETYKNIASSSATRLVSDFEDKVRMALTTLRELEKANIAYVDANTDLLSTLESLQRENEELRHRLKAPEPDLTCPHIDKLVETGELSIEAIHELYHIRDINSMLRYGLWHEKSRAEAAEAEVKRLTQERYDLAYAITGGEDAPGLLDSVPTTQLVEIARDTHRSHSADIERAMAAEAKVEDLRKSLLSDKTVEVVAEAIWSIRRVEEDRCDMSLEDIGGQESNVWQEAKYALQALASTGGEHNAE